MAPYLPVPSPSDDERSARYIVCLLSKAGTGTHHVILSVSGRGGRILRKCVFRIEDGGETFRANPTHTAELTELLASAISGNCGGGLVLRTPGNPKSVVRGWRLTEGVPIPLSAAEIFDAHCHMPNGEITPPAPDTEYEDAFSILK
ncbi:hypothetical protein ACFCZ6_39530 [Streptomyces hydrogenans]|uniref:hypothetical protein n=1 Tax=Streptomyces hydrogenans TaxID=1873719 RepID=UPI0035DE8771